MRGFNGHIPPLILESSSVKSMPHVVVFVQSFAVRTAFGVYLRIMLKGGRERGGSCQPGHRQAIQSAWRPHLALRASAEDGAGGGFVCSPKESLDYSEVIILNL